MNSESISNQLYTIIREAVEAMNDAQLRNLAVGSYLELCDSLGFEASAA